MWIWWIISLIVLIACFVFAYKVIVSSYDFMPSNKRNFLSFKKNISSSDARTEELYELKAHLKKMEENASLYEIQFSKFQQRLKALEAENEKRQSTIAAAEMEPEEDWKEMYYEENEAKQKLENELDLTRQKLEEAELSIGSVNENNSNYSSLKSDYDARLNEINSKQEHIILLQKRLDAAAEREKELQLSLLQEINSKKQLTTVDSENARLRSENDDLRRQVIEFSNKEKALQLRVARISELESKLAIHEEEKAKLTANLEMMVKQNNFFPTPKNSA